jgi:hypothetical protein
MTHQMSVNLGLLFGTAAYLGSNLLSEEQDRMHDRRGDTSERQPVQESKCSGQEKRRVGFIGLHVERDTRVEDTSNIVRLILVVIRSVTQNRYILGARNRKKKVKPNPIESRKY